MQTSYAPELAERLAPLLPPRGRILLSGGSRALAQTLEGAGVDLRAEDMSATEGQDDLRKGRFDGIVLLESPDRHGSLPDLLRRARVLLADQGKLFLAGPLPADPSSSRRRVLALSEAGFVILKEERSPAWELVTARKEGLFVWEYQEGDESQILSLFRSSFHVERSVERWRWEYAENPYGNHAISEAFTEDGTLVAHYAAYPVRFHRVAPGGAETLAAQQVGDTMTAPAVRKIGRGPTSVLARTVRHFYARFCEGRVAFNYGFNTGNIQRFSMSFVGARRIEDVPYRVRDLAAGPIQPPHRLIQWLGGYRFERVTRFDERWDELFQRVRGSYRFLVERDARYLDWRYARCPDPVYFVYAVFRRKRLVGWSVFRQKDDRLVWGDALFDPRYPDAARLLLARALAEPAHAGTRAVEIWGTDRPAWWSRWIEALGFERRPEPEGLGFVFVPFERDLEAELRADLYYMKGDGDLF